MVRHNLIVDNIFELYVLLASHSYTLTFQRDIGLQDLVFHWLMDILDDMPKGKSDYDKWIQDGKIIVKGISH